MSIIAKYKFDGSVYADLIPEFNTEFTDYTVTNEVDSENSNHIIRTIESDSLPTLMRFGNTISDGTGDYAKQYSLLEILELDTSNVIDMSLMFYPCQKLTTICNFDTNNVIDMYAMFSSCFNLISIDVSGFNTSNVTNMDYMFYSCKSLTTLDVSNFDTSNVTNMRSMFNNCNNLTSLDVSNFDTSKVTDTTNMFYNTPLLTDIGMIYCDKDTINKVASLLPTDHNITIWVESDDILQYDQYDHITYKTQKVQDTVHLNSPLLMGDTIEVIDGKTYHVHRYEKVVLDGSEDEGWVIQNTYQENNTVCFAHSNLPYSKKAGELNFTNDRFINYRNYPLQTEIFKEGFSINTSAEYGRYAYIRLDISRLSTLTLDNFRQWLSKNPTTVIYQLATPYYELISEEPLELTLLDTTDNIINNNSILPSNMSIANKELSTIAIKPSTTYTLSFDKSNEDSEVTIDICGSEQITTVLNRVELTTPSELGSGIRFISSDGCIISNVRLLEGSLVEGAIPKETFEGLQSSFDEGYIIGENLIKDLTPIWHSTYTHMCYYQIVNIKENTNYTLINPKIYDDTYFHVYGVTTENGTSSLLGYQANKDESHIRTFNTKTNTSIRVYCRLKYMDDLTLVNTPIEVNLDNNWNDLVLLEGDYTHLSEAELMRYIEKGTSHYEEEDYNHVGKYKVEYKVTGKNILDSSKFIRGSYYDNIGKIDNSYAYYLEEPLRVEPNTTYYYLAEDGTSTTVSYTVIYDENMKVISMNCDKTQYTTSAQAKYMRVSPWWVESVNKQKLECISTSKEYEPYKEDIKTYYLSSPFLEGDTIEDVNGVATHVKRYGKLVLDGSKNWSKESISENTVRYALNNFTHKFIYGTGHNNIKAFSNYNIGRYSYNNTDYIHFHFEMNKLNFFMDVKYEDTTTFKSMLNKKPLIVVAKLASPIYEPISDESILLDSYTNGHLDLNNENIPIQKTEFRNFTKELAYLQPSTDYIVRFSSDDIGVAKIYLDSSVKEINVVKGINDVIITTPSTIVNNNIIIDGIGFNISDVQVIANAIKDGDIKDFDYFKGLQSSFENGLVTDENDENYGKYKVECKIVGKNKFNASNLIETNNTIFTYIDNGIKVKNKNANVYSAIFIDLDVKPNTTYSISYKSNVISGSSLVDVYDKNNKYFYGGYPLVFNTKNNNKIKVYFYCTKTTSVLGDVEYTNIQLEEGTQATEYEPYKESIHTLYLNSPLLKGDKLVVHDGKLCHYHKMGMVILDGSDDEYWSTTGRHIPFSVIRNVGLKPDGNFGHSSTKEKVYINTLQSNIITSKDETDSEKGIYVVGSGEYNEIRIRLTDNDTIDSVKQWLQANPTTVVYELAEPYYEPIEPQISQYSFSTVKDGDMEIITVLPIEIDLTYRTDINGVSSIEEQIASIQESTDISSIIDEEVDE